MPIIKRTIFSKTSLVMILLCVLSSAFISFVSIQQQSRSIEQSLVEESRVLAGVAAKAIETGYIIEQWPFETLKKISDLESVVFLWVVSPEGEIFLADDPKMWGKIIKDPDLGSKEIIVKDSVFPGTKERMKLIIHPVFAGTQGSLFLGVSLKSVTSARNSVIFSSLSFFGLIIIFATFLALRFARGLTKPISDLTEGAEAIGRGNLDYQIKLKTGDEIERLADSFNEMTVKLREQREREKTLAQTKSEFISIAAHQLRTPLSAIKWTLRMFLDGDLGALSSKQKEFLNKGNESNERMIHLVNDLLDISRIEEGKFGFKFSKQDFVSFLRKIIGSFNLEARERHIDLRTNLPNGQIEAVFDAERLRMALSNLLDNALLYTLPGGAVDVSMKEEGKFLKVSIKDSGIGISAEQQSKIFTKFFRGDNAIRFQTEGSGLGLYLARNIVRRHGGDIWFESSEGKGSVFYLTVPTGEKLIPSRETLEEFVVGQ